MHRTPKLTQNTQHKLEVAFSYLERKCVLKVPEKRITCGSKYLCRLVCHINQEMPLRKRGETHLLDHFIARVNDGVSWTLLQTVEFVNKILWCDHSKNETSGLKVFLNGTICFQYFTIYESNLEILLNFDSLITWKRQGEKQSNCILFLFFIYFIYLFFSHSLTIKSYKGC